MGNLAYSHFKERYFKQQDHARVLEFYKIILKVKDHAHAPQSSFGSISWHHSTSR